MSLEKITTISGRGVHVPGNDIDTDRIIPARFMKCVTFDGLGEYLFHDVRKNADGSAKQHPLNDPRFQGATVLLSGANFGCGSSREHAPQAIQKYGFRAIIAPSFADIFFNNCFKNGMLPIKLDEATIDDLFARLAAHPGYKLNVDLTQCKITDAFGLSLDFEVDGFRRHCLLNGLDDIGLTLEQEPEIAAYEHAHGIV